MCSLPLLGIAHVLSLHYCHWKHRAPWFEQIDPSLPMEVLGLELQDVLADGEEDCGECETEGYGSTCCELRNS